jgi:hypothetical protein
VYYEEEKHCEFMRIIPLLLYKQRLQKTCRVCTPIPESNSTKFITAWTENFEERQREVRKKHSILECPFSAHTHHDVGRAFENRR